MLHVVTMIVLLAAIFVILSNKYTSDTQKSAFGAVGTVVGYWLAPKRSSAD